MANAICRWPSIFCIKRKLNRIIKACLSLQDVDFTGCCTRLVLESPGPSKEHQSNRLGEYRVVGDLADRPRYIQVREEQFSSVEQAEVGSVPKVLCCLCYCSTGQSCSLWFADVKFQLQFYFILHLRFFVAKALRYQLAVLF